MVPDTIGGGTRMPTVPAAVPDSGGGDERDVGINCPNSQTIPLYFWDPKGRSSWQTQQSKDGAERRE
eukprot:6022479-Prymnesium_polylepis.1